MQNGFRVPPDAWIACPNGHPVARAQQGLRFQRGWETYLTERKQSLRDADGSYRCTRCGSLWRTESGGKAYVNWTTTDPNEGAE